ncbi:hypothetical protein Z945_621 [Sulfitobacter noctilucae]|nr:hypothetical protein Z945_621 [Sulfitobacter noctilucae]
MGVLHSPCDQKRQSERRQHHLPVKQVDGIPRWRYAAYAETFWPACAGAKATGRRRPE